MRLTILTLGKNGIEEKNARAKKINRVWAFIGKRNSRQGWTITHIPSGLCLVSQFSLSLSSISFTRQEGRKLAERLSRSLSEKLPSTPKRAKEYYSNRPDEWYKISYKILAIAQQIENERK